MEESKTDSVVISAAEWRSLCTFGELRMLRRRVCCVQFPMSTRDRERLFLSSPTVKLGDASDTLVLELGPTWRSPSSRHPRLKSELVLLTMSMITSHHCVDSTSQAYFEEDARRMGIDLELGRYETPWATWIGGLRDEAHLKALDELLTVLRLEVDLKRRRPDGYRWLDILGLAENSKRVVRPRPKHAEDLLRHVRPVAGAIASVYDTAASLVAANIEWIAIRTKSKPLSKKKHKAFLTQYLNQLRQSSWTAESVWAQETSEVLDYLQKAFPRAYTAELSPQSVPVIFRLTKDAKDRRLSPELFLSCIHSLRARNQTAAALMLCAAVAGALGPEVTGRLVRVLSMNNPPTELPTGDC